MQGGSKGDFGCKIKYKVNLLLINCTKNSTFLKKAGNEGYFSISSVLLKHSCCAYGELLNSINSCSHTVMVRSHFGSEKREQRSRGCRKITWIMLLWRRGECQVWGWLRRCAGPHLEMLHVHGETQIWPGIYSCLLFISALFFMHNAVNCQLVDRFTRFIEQIIVLLMVYAGEGDCFATFYQRVNRKH